jgi:hypothetical protein
MILYYAVGGGLGHLVRGRRVLEALRLSHEAAIVTASPHARDVRIAGSVEVIELPLSLERDAASHRSWLHELIGRRGCRRVIADAFPAGIQGELCDAPVPVDYVARLLKWDVYRSAVAGDPPQLGTTWVVEELTPEHAEFVRARSARVVPLELQSAIHEADERSAGAAAFWLIVHSGPEQEVAELVEYAVELRAVASEPPDRVLVATRCPVDLPPGFAHVDVYPAARLFASAARIISAAGFNVMRETHAWRHKHDVVPFARAFDDQYLRAARRRAANDAGRDSLTASHTT